MEFNREQQQAMEHKDGPMLVLAGPGSGKTEVIIRRTRKLIQNYQVAPSSILVVTFTKAAAGQMRERFLHLCGVEKSQVTFGTFHGIFYGILRQAYGITSANIAGEEIKYQILRQILQNSSLQMEDENDLLESLARAVLNLVLFHMLFSYMWPQIVLLDQPLRLTLKNSLNCMIAFLPHALAAALVTILFWGLVILCMPLGLLLMLVFGFWFQCEICCQIVYGDLNRVFHIEESILKSWDDWR